MSLVCRGLLELICYSPSYLSNEVFLKYKLYQIECFFQSVFCIEQRGPNTGMRPANVFCMPYYAK